MKRIHGHEINIPDLEEAYIQALAAGCIQVRVAEPTLVQAGECILDPEVGCIQVQEVVFIPAQVEDYIPVQEVVFIPAQVEDYIPALEEGYTAVRAVDCILDPAQVLIEAISPLGLYLLNVSRNSKCTT